MRFGMDFGGTNLKAGVFSEDGQVIEFVERPLTELTASGDLLEKMITHAHEIARKHPIAAGGLAIKGLINSATGVMEDDVGAGALLAGKNLRQPFAEALHIPFAVENDARAYAWGEWKFGAGAGSRVMVCMTLGTGLGCAVVNEKKPYQGANALGGILGGHISIDRNGPECPCGNRGCLELYCSATALAARIREAHPHLATAADPLPDFFAAVGENKAAHRQTLHAFQTDLAIGIVNAIHAYGPDRVVLGGGVMNSAALILPELIRMVHRRAWTIPRGKVDIVAAKLGNRAAAMGAAFHPSLDA